VKVDIRQDPERMRPADIPAIVGNPRKLTRATGWSPAIPLRQTLGDLLEYWRQQAAVAPAARA
jgi:GDP-4-dehydro-6-deoxy-D-mannose reductase